ncbi:DUF6796 family protein [Neolewinella persica]|uniref:DUF6796 family protein n=1 Tax=Neolewinella persica TaxID=70998 RepID=UPI0003A4B7A9|nr:DUF6796 family protein [Neolewinella persica]
MNERKIVLITGLLGLLASITVGFGEFLLHYSSTMTENTGNYHFFASIPKQNLIYGHFIAVAGTPFYFVGYYHLYRMLKGKDSRWAAAVFCLGILAFTVGGFWISSRAFLGTIVQLGGQIEAGVYQEILDNYTLISESLVTALRIIILLLSVAFVAAILRTSTYYDRWMAFFNPFALLLLVFGIYFAVPVVGRYIAPIAMNVAHFVLFSVSLIQFNKNYQ